MSKLEKKIIEVLKKKLMRLQKRLQERRGRGILLAEHIDRLSAAIDALNGELVCNVCGTHLTGI